MRALLYFFLLLIFFGFLYFAVKATLEIHAYMQYNKKINAELSSVIIREEKKVYIVAIFLLPNRATIKTDLLGPFPNRYVAEGMLDSIRFGVYELWTNEKDAVLKKNFPIKLVVSSLFILGILIYFMLLCRRCLQ